MINVTVFDHKEREHRFTVNKNWTIKQVKESCEDLFNIDKSKQLFYGKTGEITTDENIGEQLKDGDLIFIRSKDGNIFKLDARIKFMTAIKSISTVKQQELLSSMVIDNLNIILPVMAAGLSQDEELATKFMAKFEKKFADQQNELKLNENDDQQQQLSSNNSLTELPNYLLDVAFQYLEFREIIHKVISLNKSLYIGFKEYVNCPYSMKDWHHRDFFAKYFNDQYHKGLSSQFMRSKVLQTMGIFRKVRDLYIDSSAFREALRAWFPVANDDKNRCIQQAVFKLFPNVENIKIEGHAFNDVNALIDREIFSKCRIKNMTLTRPYIMHQTQDEDYEKMYEFLDQCQPSIQTLSIEIMHISAEVRYIMSDANIKNVKPNRWSNWTQWRSLLLNQIPNTLMYQLIKQLPPQQMKKILLIADKDDEQEYNEFDIIKYCGSDIKTRKVFKNVEEMVIRNIPFSCGFIQLLLETKMKQLAKLQYGGFNDDELIKVLELLTLNISSVNIKTLGLNADEFGFSDNLLEALDKFFEATSENKDKFMLRIDSMYVGFEFALMRRMIIILPSLINKLSKYFKQWILEIILPYDWTTFHEEFASSISALSNFKIYDQNGEKIKRGHNKIIHSFTIMNVNDVDKNKDVMNMNKYVPEFSLWPGWARSFQQ